MTEARKLVLYHAPNSRSTATRMLLEELGAPYELRVLNLKAGEQGKPDYLAINPMGKVPALRDGDAVITEQVAIFIHLADLFPAAKLAPPPGDAQRGPYLRWLVFYGSCFEPALMDRAAKRDATPTAQSPYGDFDTVLGALVGQLGKARYLLGEQFSAADVLWSSALGWTTAWKLVPELPEITAYLGRVGKRPATAKVRALDAQIAAEQEKAKATA